MLELCKNTDENRNCDLSFPEIENNSKNVDVSQKNLGRGVYVHLSLCP